MRDKLTEDVIHTIDVIVHSFRINESNEAFKYFDKLIQYIGLYMNNMQSNKDTIQEINEFLGSLVNAMDNKDYVLVCDILKYGIRPIL